MRIFGQLEHELTPSQKHQPEVEAEGDAGADCCSNHQRARTLGASPCGASSNHPREHRCADVPKDPDISLPVEGVRQDSSVNDRRDDAARLQGRARQ